LVGERTVNQAENWWYQRRWSSFRRGTHPISLEWDDGRAAAVLYEEGAPRTALAIEQALPLEVPVIHVAWSGEMCMGVETYDIGVDTAENEVRLVRPGDLTFDPKYDELGFVYGDAECRLPSGPNTVVVYGAVVSGLDGFAAWARRRRFEGVGTLRIARGD
jgi:hypothetical protein